MVDVWHMRLVCKKYVATKYPLFCTGPPEGIELIEVTQKLMSAVEHDWPILATYLEIPGDVLAAIKVDEPTLYRKVNKILRYWIESDEDHDRKQLVSILPAHYGISGVLKKIS